MNFGPIDKLFDVLRDIIGEDLTLGMWVLLTLLLVAQEIGYRLGRFVRRWREPLEAEKSSLNFATAGMVGLLAFLLGISLSMASGRYEARRDSVLAEANSIGTTWLRAGLVGGAEGQAIQRALRDYTKLRIDTVNGGETPDENRPDVRQDGRAPERHVAGCPAGGGAGADPNHCLAGRLAQRNPRSVTDQPAQFLRQRAGLRHPPADPGVDVDDAPLATGSGSWAAARS
jgi:hypothetical protein